MMIEICTCFIEYKLQKKVLVKLIHITKSGNKKLINVKAYTTTTHYTYYLIPFNTIARLDTIPTKRWNVSKLIHVSGIVVVVVLDNIPSLRCIISRTKVCNIGTSPRPPLLLPSSLLFVQQSFIF